jgi:hypothetical protein
LGAVEFNGDNQTAMVFDPMAGSNVTVLKANAIQPGRLLTLTNIKAFDILAGELVADVKEIKADVCVSAGATLVLHTQTLDGDIINDGTLNVVIVEHTGTITNNGVINGVINGIPYGIWWHDYEYAESLALECTANDYDASPVTKMDEDVTLEGGLYEASIFFDASIDATNRQCVVGWFINDVLIDTEFIKESKDVTDLLYAGKTVPMTLPAGTNNVKIKYGKRGGLGVAVACVSNVRAIFNRKG